jgi:hypothetical protein
MYDTPSAVENVNTQASRIATIPLSNQPLKRGASESYTLS